jgi:hypothetical protein
MTTAANPPQPTAASSIAAGRKDKNEGVLEFRKVISSGKLYPRFIIFSVARNVPGDLKESDIIKPAWTYSNTMSQYIKK